MLSRLISLLISLALGSLFILLIIVIFNKFNIKPNDTNKNQYNWLNIPSIIGMAIFIGYIIFGLWSISNWKQARFDHILIIFLLLSIIGVISSVVMVIMNIHGKSWLIIGSLGGPISTILIFLIDGIVEIKKSHSFDEAFYLFSGIFFIGILIGWFLPRKIAGLLTAIGLSISVMVIYLFIKNRIHPFSYTRGPNGLLLSLVAGSFYAGIAGFITYCLMQVFRKKA